MTTATIGNTRSQSKKVSARWRGSYPVCIGGKRNCPPEDCGGAWGYAQLLAILADPNHPEHADQIDWIGEEFDPNEFNLDRANTVLAARFKKNRRRLIGYTVGDVGGE